MASTTGETPPDQILTDIQKELDGYEAKIVKGKPAAIRGTVISTLFALGFFTGALQVNDDKTLSNDALRTLLIGLGITGLAGVAAFGSNIDDLDSISESKRRKFLQDLMKQHGDSGISAR